MRQDVAVWLGLVALSGGCLRDPGAPVALTATEGWERVEGSDDPFTGEGGADVECPPDAFQVADFGGVDLLELRTDGCPRISVTQASLARIPKGAPVGVRIWHFELTSIEPAEATLALAFGDTEVWRETLPIPSPGAMVIGDWEATDTWPEGTPITLHVHNHGLNSYHLVELSLWPSGRE